MDEDVLFVTNWIYTVGIGNKKCINSERNVWEIFDWGLSKWTAFEVFPIVWYLTDSSVSYNSLKFLHFCNVKSFSLLQIMRDKNRNNENMWWYMKYSLKIVMQNV